MILIDSNTGEKIRNLIVSFFRFLGGQISTLTPGQIWMLIDSLLDQDVQASLIELAGHQGKVALQTLVNQLLRKDIQMLDMLKMANG